MPTVLTAALEYTAKGVPVFPVNPRTKRPYVKKTSGHKGGFHEATTDPEQIKKWWQQFPDAMIGMPTGERSGIWVSDEDIDKKKGIDGCKALAELVAKNNPLPETRICITPRGGRHRHWLCVGRAKFIRNSTSKVAPGIDIRGNGGYAIIPPSICANGASYQWENGKDLGTAPDWFVEAALGASKSTQARRPTARALAALAQECAIVANSPAGKRNDALNTAAFNLGQLIASGELDEQEVRDCLFKAAEKCGLVADDGAQATWATIDSGLQAGLAQPRPQPQPPQGPQAQPQPTPPPQPRPQPRRLPVIRIAEGQLVRAIDQAEAALIAAGGRHIYQRGDLLVRPIKSKLKAADDRYTFNWQLIPLSKPFMVETFMRVARFEKIDLRVGGYVPKDCPDKVAETYLSRIGHWKLPVLLAVVNAPFLRMNGTLCDRPGYDPASALLFHPDGQQFPVIAVTPTLNDARAALKHLDNTLLEEFPFVEKIDRAVALSLLLSGLDRRSMPAAPLHGFTSPIAGTGKSLLVDLASVLATGDVAPVTSLGKSEEELEKRLGAALIAGDQTVTFDNCDRELTGSLLCQALTQQRLKIRLLGFSRQVDTPITSLFCATGNNLTFADDVTRRALLCRLDAGMERPETRSFKRNVLETARSERGQLVAAALTVLRAWHVAKTTIGIEPLGSFEDWSFRIRQPLLWLDQADPCDSIVTVRENDPSRTLLAAVLEEWKRCLGVGAFTVQQVIARAMVDQDFFGAIAAVAAEGQSGLSNKRLGMWLSKNNGRIIGRLRLMKKAVSAGYPLWQVIQI